MKRLTTLMVAVVLSTVAFAQSPDLFNYQGIARDNGGAVLQNQNIGLQITIRETTNSGNIVYQEAHSPTTNQFGLFTVQVGAGTVVSGTMAGIAWDGDAHYMEVEMDETGGTNYQAMGTQQLISVPYAKHATTADSINDADADPANELQVLSTNGDTLFISNGNYVVLTFNDSDDQNLNFTNDSLYIEDGNGVDLGSLNDTDWTINGSDMYNMNNNVGIGTTSPSQKLHVQGYATATGGFMANGMLALSRTGFNLQHGYSAAVVDQIFYTGSSADERMRILSTGEVGIGTNAPTSELEVTGTGQTDITIDAPNAAHSRLVFQEGGADRWHIVSTHNTENLQFAETGQGNRMTIEQGGNVGIGNSSPTEKLDVTGGVAMDSIEVRGLPSFCAHKAATQTIIQSSYTEISNWQTTGFSHLHDNGNHFDETTGRFTAPRDGFYHFSAQISHDGIQTGGGFWLSLLVNNVVSNSVGQGLDSRRNIASTSRATQHVSATLKLNAGDVVSVYTLSLITTSYDIRPDSGFSGYMISDF